MTPQQLLDLAGRLLDNPTPGTRHHWPRICVWLIRLSLEKALDQYWSRKLPEAAACPMRPQLLLLPRYAGQEIAERASAAWTGLSRAAHHHAYELAPTAAELRDWHVSVTRLTEDLIAAAS